MIDIKDLYWVAGFQWKQDKYKRGLPKIKPNPLDRDKEGD